MRERDGSEWWLYKQVHETADSCSGLIEEMLNRNPKYQMSVFLLVAKNDIYETFNTMNTEKFLIKFGEANNNKSIFSVKIAKNDENKQFGNALIVRTPKREVYLALTDEPRQFLESVFRPFLNSFYPEISRAFLSSNELRQVLERLENTTGGEIIVDRITAYRRILYKVTYNTKTKKKEESSDTKESAVIYTKRPYQETFNDAIANDQWIDKIQFHLISKDTIRLGGYFSRNGLFKFRHAFSPFYQTLLPFIIEIIEKKFKLYSNRSRIENKTQISPLVIDLDYDVFKDTAQNNRFIQSIKKMSYVSTSVYHSNPYVHLSLVDYLDGSSFDIWVLSANRITIVPQLRASGASVARLMNHIFERFREGTVSEYEGYVKST